ncbi:solute carrier family 28 member 3-like [Diadema antillarum]|uniref:solute carrier family 28 member 3-like n=1 Tax=Diadema antillarum TaxID=105358 RepID=UPI003A88EE91
MIEDKFECNMDNHIADSPDSGKFSVCLDLDFTGSDLESSGYILGRERERKPVIRTLQNEYNDIELQKVDASLPTSTPKKPKNGIMDPEASADVTADNTIVVEIDGHDPSDRDNCWMGMDIGEHLKDSYQANRKVYKGVFAAILLIAYLIYLVFASIHDIKEAMTLLIITGVAVVLYTYTVIRDTSSDSFTENVVVPAEGCLDKAWPRLRWVVLVISLAGFAVLLYFLTRENPIQLISLAGLAIFIFFSFIISKYPRHIKWRPIIWGLVLQFILGLLILRTRPGFVVFDWLGNLVQTFLNYSTAGSIFLFGELYYQHYFAMAVLPIIIYFSSVIAVLYYWGVMQTVIGKIAWLMQRTMKTTASESLSAAGNIFIGQTEAPLLIRPYLPKMTRSEIHAVMTGGFATIAGSVLGAFVLSGISATHLIAASVMSAPAALAVSKLIYPETEESQTVTVEDVKLPKGDERNFIEAASKGASTAVPLVLNIAANLITFLALKALLNGILSYLGGLVGFPQLSFELICSYVFMPIAYMMGVEWADCRTVAELIGIKTFINEFVAYERLAVILDERAQGLNDFSERSEVIATYALCGFANIGSIGIQLGGLTPLAPSKAADLAAVAVRALIAGTVACFMTACIAGVLFVPAPVVMANATMSADAGTMATMLFTTITS